MSQVLPPVAASVTAELVAELSPRLRKRLDAGVTKLAGRPAVRDGDTVRIAVDDSIDLELHAPGGTVTRAEDVRCGCLLAPDCLHRAAAASAAPVAEAEASTAEEAREGGAREDAAGEEAAAGADNSPTTRAGSADAANASPPEVPAPGQLAAAQALLRATAAVLDAGADGAGAVVQAEMLRAAHSARLAGLPRAAASAVSVVTAVRAARSGDPAYRSADLVAALGDVLTVAHRLPYATGPELAELRGTARQPYTPDGSLRLYGLFSEPVLTASGHAGAVSWTADAEGRLCTVSDVAPGGVGRAVGAADRAVRVGDTTLTHRELSRAGLAVSGATVSPTGRLGAGASVRAVRASGVGWDEEPLGRLWAVPVADQVARALRGGHDLLFLDVTPLGTAREATGDVLLADCAGLTVRLGVAHDDPALPYRDNLRLLATARDGRLRVVARLVPAPLPRALLLAVEHPTTAGARVDLGFDRLRRADLAAAATPPAAATAVPSPSGGAPSNGAPSAGALVDEGPYGEAPLHLLGRRVHRAASGGRRVLALPGGGPAADDRRLRDHGLATAADLLTELCAAAADRARDAFGRLLPADTDRFARAWLAATRYGQEVDLALCAAAWSAGRRSPAPAARGHAAHPAR
ncbi:hypothetical protein AB0F77_40895 [Streptomyces sp. NPDC026672]|uniref:hypothetical protein n=1 Tax=unclassified Streptomyces TaxID=2593676 RepID=UPI0033D2988B